jgi:hypothetical protein
MTAGAGAAPFAHGSHHISQRCAGISAGQQILAGLPVVTTDPYRQTPGTVGRSDHARHLQTEDLPAQDAVLEDRLRAVFAK